MKTVTITSDFTGYPANKKREFRTGETVEVADGFAEMLVDKGLAREGAARTASRAADTADADAATEKDKSK